MMAAAVGGNNIVWFTYTGAVGEVIPLEATHINVLARVIPGFAFRGHPNVIEVFCHDVVEKIERNAFFRCPSLRRVIMPGVKVAWWQAFAECPALTDVECGKLEIIGLSAFKSCKSLRGINLPSARIVEQMVFSECKELTEVKFSNKLERIGEKAFFRCTSLERITIPLKDGLIAEDDIFQACENLMYVDLVEGELHETIAALQLGEWRNDMNEEIDSISDILCDADVGNYVILEYDNYEGENAQAIRTWIRSVLDKIIHYQAEHQRVLDDATTTLQYDLPSDILTNNVLPFLALPLHSFGGDAGRT